MKLLIQPEDGVAPLVAAIKKAKKSVDIVVFRFDRAEIETALKDAAERGVSVSALIAYANHGGEKSLRKLEMRLLEAGVTVSRTSDDLVALSRQAADHRPAPALRPVLQLHPSRYRPQSRLRDRHEETQARRGSAEAAQGGQRSNTLQGRPRHLRRQPGQRAQAAPRAHSQGQERAAHLRSQDCRRGDACAR